MTENARAGVAPESKENLYLELSRGATLYDTIWFTGCKFFFPPESPRSDS
jgi:hypothetical protein